MLCRDIFHRVEIELREGAIALSEPGVDIYDLVYTAVGILVRFTGVNEPLDKSG